VGVLDEAERLFVQASGPCGIGGGLHARRRDFCALGHGWNCANPGDKVCAEEVLGWNAGLRVSMVCASCFGVVSCPGSVLEGVARMCACACPRVELAQMTCVALTVQSAVA
jgi:hypothetical protein